MTNASEGKHMNASETYTWYCEWFQIHYGRPFKITREEWEWWCRQPRTPQRQSDIEFDTAKEREGDAQ